MLDIACLRRFAIFHINAVLKNSSTRWLATWFACQRISVSQQVSVASKIVILGVRCHVSFRVSPLLVSGNRAKGERIGGCGVRAVFELQKAHVVHSL